MPSVILEFQVQSKTNIGIRRGEAVRIDNIIKSFTNRTPTILGSDDFSKYSILIPLLEKENESHILFEVRSEQLRRQPGEICFPGGRIDQSDKDEKYTAIRETCEELGIQENSLSNIYPTDYLISPYGTIIYPFIGVLSNKVAIKPNAAEVGEVFTVPITYFLQNEPDVYEINMNIEPDKDFPYNLIIGGENYKWQVHKQKEYFYNYENKVIWGLTARILKHFIDITRNGLNG